jgi:type VI secretion system protein ImpH
MGTARRREAPDLRERLHREPHRFDFFQAVRLLERLAREDPSAARQPVGSDGAAGQECVRFRALPSLSHPPAAVAQLRRPAGARPGDHAPAPESPEMAVAFLGLTGPAGVLPPHYTALLLRRLRAKDTSLRDWLDLFNHRLVSLFYRAWEKYRLPFAYERSRQDGPATEPEKVGQALRCLVGRGTAGVRGRQDVPEDAFLYYAGHFAHHPRSAAGLERLLSDYFGLPIRVQQFQGQRLRLHRDDQTRLPSRQRARGLNCRLGVDVVVGDHVWDAQCKFRLRVGPLTYREFRRFFPLGGDLLRLLSQLTRSYVGGEFTFDVQLVLRPAEVPRMRLGGKGDGAAHLGWNTWVASRQYARDVDDVVFQAVEE